MVRDAIMIIGTKSNYGVVYLKLSFYFVPVMFKGGCPLHSLILGFKSTLFFSEDLLVGLLQSLLRMINRFIRNVNIFTNFK